MSFPTWHGRILYPNISIQFPDEGGLSVTILELPSVTIPESPGVSVPEGGSNPSVCISQSNDGDLIVSIPSGMAATIPVEQNRDMFVNGTIVKLSSPKPLQRVVNFPSGGTIRLIRSKNRVWIEGPGASMDPLP
jgi:hypothetical protein